jgi:hypothetical protein
MNDYENNFEDGMQEGQDVNQYIKEAASMYDEKQY